MENLDLNLRSGYLFFGKVDIKKEHSVTYDLGLNELVVFV